MSESSFKLPSSLLPYRAFLEQQLRNCCCCSPASDKPSALMSMATTGKDGEPPVTPYSFVSGTSTSSCCNCSPTPLQITTGGITMLVSLKKMTRYLKDEELREQLYTSFDKALTDLIAEYSGTSSNPAWLGTQGDIASLLASLSVSAELYPDPVFREDVMQVAAYIATKASDAQCSEEH